MKKQIIKSTKTIEKAVTAPFDQPLPVIPLNSLNTQKPPIFTNKPVRSVFRPQNIRPISYHGTGHRG